MTTCTEEDRAEAIQAVLKRRERSRQYYLEHKEERTAYNRDNRERIAAYNRQYHCDNKEERAAHDRQYYQEHLEEQAERDSQYRKEHPEVNKCARAKRRALIEGSDGNFTTEEFNLLCEFFENRCAYCGEELPLGPDHVIPLSRGGSNSIDNILPACLSCNSKKYTMTYDEFMERKKREDRA